MHSEMKRKVNFPFAFHSFFRNFAAVKKCYILMMLLLSLSVTAQNYRPHDFTFSYLFEQMGETDMEEMEDSVRQLVTQYSFSTPDRYINALGGLLAVAEAKGNLWTESDWLERWAEHDHERLSTIRLSALYDSGRDQDDVRQTLESLLWMPEKGRWGAFRDDKGLCRLHEWATPSVQCAPVLAGACSQDIAYQTMRSLDKMPLQPEMYFPAALANFQTGRNQRGYELLLSGLQHQVYDGKSPVDSMLLAGGALLEGLFGIYADAFDKYCIIWPGVPDSWETFSVHTPGVDYTFLRSGRKIIVDVTQHFGKPKQIVLRLNLGMGAFMDVAGNSNRHQVFTVKVPVKLPEVVWYDTYDIPEEQPMLGLDEPDFNRKFKTQRIDGFLNDSVYFDVDERFFVGNDYVVSGIPFRLAPPERNVTYVSYPDTLSVPVSGSAEQAWVLLTGTTNDRERYISNGLIVARYQDGSTDTLPLINPDNWAPLPDGRLRRLCLHLDASKKLASIEVHPQSEDIQIGLMGITLQ